MFWCSNVGAARNMALHAKLRTVIELLFMRRFMCVAPDAGLVFEELEGVASDFDFALWLFAMTIGARDFVVFSAKRKLCALGVVENHRLKPGVVVALNAVTTCKTVFATHEVNRIFFVALVAI